MYKGGGDLGRVSRSTIESTILTMTPDPKYLVNLTRNENEGLSTKKEPTL